MGRSPLVRHRKAERANDRAPVQHPRRESLLAAAGFGMLKRAEFGGGSNYFARVEQGRRLKPCSCSSTIITKRKGVRPICRLLAINPSTYNAY